MSIKSTTDMQSRLVVKSVGDIERCVIERLWAFTPQCSGSLVSLLFAAVLYLLEMTEILVCDFAVYLGILC